MRKGVQALKIGGFVKGDEVKVIKGSFKNLRATVSLIYEGREEVQLNFHRKASLKLHQKEIKRALKEKLSCLDLTDYFMILFA
jgi:transcription antitermination factor NusG